MKILLVGSKNLLVRSIIKKFHREGHIVYLLRKNDFKDKSDLIYNYLKFSPIDPLCEESFKTYNFDVVFYCNDNILKDKDEYYLKKVFKKNTEMLLNIFSISVNNNVGKFIYASTTDVYENLNYISFNEDSNLNPISINGIEKYSCEKNLELWNKLMKISVVILRFSKIYGEGSFLNEEKPFNIYNSKKIESDNYIKKLVQNDDYIYSDDAANAVYIVSSGDYKGVYNITTHKSNDEFQIPKELNERIVNQFRIFEKDEIKRHSKVYSFSNKKALNELEWSPEVDFNEGMNIVLEDLVKENLSIYKSDYKKKNKKNKKIKNQISNSKRKWFENFILYLVVLVIYFLNKEMIYSFFEVGFVYLVLTGIFYGVKQSAVGFIIWTASYLGLMNLTDMSLNREQNISSIIIKICFYFIISISIAFIIDKIKESKYKMSLNLKEIKKRLEYSEKKLKEIKNENINLENKLINSKNTLDKMYSITINLSSLNPYKILLNSIPIIEEMMETDSVSIYLNSNSAEKYRLVSCSKTEKFKSELTVDINKFGFEDSCDSIYINRLLDDNMPFMSLPIVVNGKIKGIISINNIDFEKVNLSSEIMFKTLGNIISKSLEKAFTYWNDTLDKRLISGTNFLKKDEFNKMNKFFEESKIKYDIDYIIVVIKKSDNYINMYNGLSCKTRETDIIGLNNEGNISLILLNTNYIKLDNVDERFKGFDIVRWERVS